MKKALLIPVKDPANAKTRLAGLLSLDERRRLAWAMFEDTSRAASGTTGAPGIILVSSYAPAIAYARALGWDVLVEESQGSESASVDWASGILGERGFEAVLRLPADLPLVRAEDIDALLAVEVRPPAAILVASRDGTGTNAILRTPPTLFPSRFGPNSLELHRNEAARAGAECLEVPNERIGLDIDEPADLLALLEFGGNSVAIQTLLQMRIPERLGTSHSEL